MDSCCDCINIAITCICNYYTNTGYVHKKSSYQSKEVNTHTHSLRKICCPHRKSDNDIVIECTSPYAITELKTKLVTLLTTTLCLYTHSTADNASVKDGPVYDTVQQTQSVI